MAESLDALVAGCRRGQPAAQRALYERLGHQLMGVCLRYCPSREEAEDALQLAFVKIFTRLDQFRGQGPFEAWARRIAVTTSLNLWQQHRQRGLHFDLTDEAYDLPAPGGTPFDQLSADELVQQLHALPPGYRTVLNLYAIEGYSHAEIAELLGISEGTSKSQLSRARRLLEARLHQQAHISRCHD
ncbi:RNA polymerase sigma factor [Hymenobacter psychrophilus]|uniref:RNA polymerase sigma-70 factor, ECF subfamily n=1 Tax=Hymenobacter psychrophilus TaxID=651662 RepID=A0A1H3B2T4_9BACT|nr:sigma-70 family RNA polymerase sigma factor [Hymenobacter psychrophilus]SDX35998.1 RNA polymerase sigma-70 factor, ECF subfamily [Hymenobacter psychrophilus]